MLRVQVDLVLGAVQPEADRPLSLTAIKVIDEQRLRLMGTWQATACAPGCEPLEDRGACLPGPCLPPAWQGMPLLRPAGSGACGWCR